MLNFENVPNASNGGIVVLPLEAYHRLVAERDEAIKTHQEFLQSLVTVTHYDWRKCIIANFNSDALYDLACKALAAQFSEEELAKYDIVKRDCFFTGTPDIATLRPDATGAVEVDDYED